MTKRTIAIATKFPRMARQRTKKTRSNLTKPKRQRKTLKRLVYGFLESKSSNGSSAFAQSLICLRHRSSFAAPAMPIYRKLWEKIRKKMPKKGRGKADGLDPLNLPVELQTALDALYGHYTKTYDLWQKENINVPPVFIIVCNNTSTSKLVHDYVSGFHRLADDGKTNVYHAGRLELFRNHDDSGNRLARPRTLLIDSEQLESGEALDPEFREMAADEIERFRREMIERGDVEKSRKITDQDLLREVMNTVGKEGKLGESIRCVVSVSMLTEGWDANTVTHILGVRAFGTQLLCEQVVGRGLRRMSYVATDNGHFEPEYADVYGV